jgi:hypothetical protein
VCSNIRVFDLLCPPQESLVARLPGLMEMGQQGVCVSYCADRNVLYCGGMKGGIGAYDLRMRKSLYSRGGVHAGRVSSVEYVRSVDALLSVDVGSVCVGGDLLCSGSIGTVLCGGGILSAQGSVLRYHARVAGV